MSDSSQRSGAAHFTFENSGQAGLTAGIATMGMVFAQGAVHAGDRLSAISGHVTAQAQMDVKTTYEDGSVKMAVLSIERPALAAGAVFAVELAAGHGGTAAPALDLMAGLAGHQATITLGGGKAIDVLDALRSALAHGDASIWQQGPLASQARVEIDGPASQRILCDVTVFANGGITLDVQINNDVALGAQGGRVAQDITINLDGRQVAHETVNQGQYQNWHRGFSSDGANGGQGLGDAASGWLNIRHDIGALEATGAVASYDLSVGVSETLLNTYAAATRAPGWDAPLSTQGVATYMPGTGGRSDIGFTTAPNAAWLISQDPRAAAFAIGQAEAASAIPWHMWDAKQDEWLGTDSHPALWIDGRAGTSLPGDPNATALTQQPDGQTGWTLDTAHQPDLSFVPYVLTGERWMLDNLQAQSAWNIVAQWPVSRGDGQDLVVRDNQVRGAAWSLRQIDEAAWASPDGSPEQAYFAQASDANWSWLVSQIPAWTVQQGEAHGWLPGAYGTAGALPPWQQDYFASTAIAAARHGNADAATFLEWQANFLIGRFTHEAQGFAQHDGAAYLVAIADPTTGTPYASWAQIGAATVARGWSNGTGWEHSQGDYPQLALATLAGIAGLGGPSAAAARAAYTALLAEAPPFTSAADFNRDPSFSIAAPVNPPPPASDEALSIVLGAEAWNGDPNAIVTVDGVEVFNGAVSASHAAGGAEIQLGHFAAHSAHQISVAFTNDDWGGTAATDRNLYVEDVRINGVSTGDSAALLRNGATVFDLAATHVAPPPIVTPPPPPAMVTLAAVLGAQAYQGNPIAIVTVDGKEVFHGEVSAPNATGGAALQLGSIDPTLAHTVTVAFINDLWGGNTAADRNLYVEDILVAGHPTGDHAALFDNSTVSFSLPAGLAVPPAPANGIILRLSQDAWQGDARYSVKLDGVVLVADGVAGASHALGQHDVLTLHPNLAAGSHNLVVSFTNDAWGGTATTDRNLYIDGLSVNGIDLGQRAALLSAGDASFSFSIPPPAPVNDTLRIGLSADSWMGDPRFLVFIDGVQSGDARVVAASHAAGKTEFIDIVVPHSAGPHELSVRFINDDWGGTALTDRNLYVDSVAINGTDLHDHAALLRVGDAVFAF